MAILYANGWEDGDVGAAEAGVSYSVCFNLPSGGRRGGGAFFPNSSTGLATFAIPELSTIFAHLALKTTTGTGGTGAFIGFANGSTRHVVLEVDASGAILVNRSATLIGQSAPGVITPGVFYSIQVKVVIHDTLGSVEVRLNGSDTPVVNLANVDTRNGTTSTANNVRLGSGVGGSSTAYDDFVIWDSTGTINNSWLGDVRVDSYLPTADGDASAMTPSSGTEHWSLVDEVPASGTDYVESDVVGATDLFQLSDMLHTPTTIHAVLPVAQMLKSDTGTREAATVLKSGATTNVGANVALATTSAKYWRVLELDPNGSVPWTKAAINAMQAGARVTV